MTPDTVDAETVFERQMDDWLRDAFDDDAPLVCGLENPDVCEACS